MAVTVLDSEWHGWPQVCLSCNPPPRDTQELLGPQDPLRVRTYEWGVGVALLALGVGPGALALPGPILLLHTIYLHAEVPWPLGPLRYVLVSPRMHRRHHQVSVHGDSCNFAGMFSLLDHAFGTWQDPEEEFEGGGAIRCGVDGRSIPETLAGQLADPVARTLRALQASSQRRASR